MNCGTISAFAGRSGLDSLLAEVVGISLIELGNTFTDTSFIDGDAWHTLISGIAGMKALPLSTERGFANTTPDVTIDTSNVGKQEVTSKPFPAFKGSLDGSYCDYKTVEALDGKTYDIVLHLKDGKIAGTRGQSLQIRGLRATINTYFGLPLAENRLDSYPIWVNFKSITDFINMWVASPGFTLIDLFDFVPAGLQATQTSILAADKFFMSLSNRGDGQGNADAVVADFKVLGSSVGTNDVGVTAVDPLGGGAYDVTVQKNVGTVAESLASGEWVAIQVQLDDATYITYVSNVVQVVQTA